MSCAVSHASCESAGTPKVIFHRLDIADRKSVEEFAKWAKAELGQVDLLINNAGEPALASAPASEHHIDGACATLKGRVMIHGTNCTGIAFKGNVFGPEEAQTTMATNFEGTRAVCEAVAPLIPSGGRIVNVCSLAGAGARLC